jgi:hypothetical protein
MPSPKGKTPVPRTPKTSPWAEAADPANKPQSLSRERIRQIERQALFKVAVALRARGLYPEDLL